MNGNTDTINCLDNWCILLKREIENPTEGMNDLLNVIRIESHLLYEGAKGKPEHVKFLDFVWTWRTLIEKLMKIQLTPDLITDLQFCNRVEFDYLEGTHEKNISNESEEILIDDKPIDSAKLKMDILNELGIVQMLLDRQKKIHGHSIPYQISKNLIKLGLFKKSQLSTIQQHVNNINNGNYTVNKSDLVESVLRNMKLFE